MRKITSLLLASALLLLTACSSSGRMADEAYAMPAMRMAKSAAMASDQAVPQERMMAYETEIRVKVEDIDAARAELSSSLKKHQSITLVERETYILARVPVTAYQQFINDVQHTDGDAVIEITGEDVTDYYDDVVLSLESKRTLKQRYLALLEKAKDVSDMLAIERELERLDLEIKRLEGNKLNTEKRVEYTLVRVYISQKETRVLGPVGWVFSKGYAAVKRLFVWRE